jgi:aryl-alcohol dehydrogenase-like predicted oxidoreductase
MLSPRLTLGTAQLGTSYGIANRRGRLEPRAVDRILRTAFELGVRSLDTAPDYGDAEARIGRFLTREGRPEGLEVCTKLPRLRPALSSIELDRIVMEWLEGSRRRLSVETIDYYLVHSAATLEEYGEQLIRILSRCQQRGWVRHIGVSVYGPDDALVALSFAELGAIQFPFNVFDGRIRRQGIADQLKDAGYVTFARSPLLQGLLTLSADELPNTVAAARPWMGAWCELLRIYDADPVRAALAYAATNADTDYIVLGVESCEQLRVVLECLNEPLPDGLTDEVERRFNAVPASVIDPRLWGPARS